MITQLELDELTDSFSDSEIAAQLGVDRKTVSNWREKLNVLSFTQKTGLVRLNGKSVLKSESSAIGAGLLKGGKRNRTFKTDSYTTFFDEIDTPAKAYFLGFIAADGYVRRSGKEVAIYIHSKDVEILHTLLNESGWKESKISERVNLAGNTMVSLSLYSKHLVNSLSSWGINPAKSHNLKIIRPIPEPFQKDFVRGVWDGDGHVGNKTFNLVSASEAFIFQIQEMIFLNTGIQLRIRRPSGRNEIYLEGVKSTGDALRWMYQDAYPVLERKAMQFSRFWS